MILAATLLSIIIEASVSAEASAPHTPSAPDSVANNTFSEMVRIVCGNKIEYSPNPNITTSRGQLVLFPGDTVPESFHRSSLPDSALASPNTPQNLKALDYLFTVYEKNDYYETGYWGRDDIPIDKAIYSGQLPPCGLEDFRVPIIGPVTSGFGYREKYHRFHKGIDLHLCIGDTVRAALPGRIVRKGYEHGGYGHFIIVAHTNGIETRYAHLQGPLVEVEDIVYAGQPIALGGNSGNSTGPHLHFEIRYLGRAIDPQRVFNFYDFKP